MSLIMTIFLVAALVITAGMGVLLVFRARKRSWIVGAGRVALTVVSAIVAIPVANALSDVLADVIYDLLLPILGEPVTGVLTDLPVGAEGLRVLATMLASPIVYFLAFILIRVLLGVIFSIVATFVPILRKPWVNVASMISGGVNAVLIMLVALVPLCGFCMLGGHVLDEVTATADAHGSKTLTEALDKVDLTTADLAAVADELEGSPVVIAVHHTVGKPIFGALTTRTLDASATHGQVIEMQLEDELCGLVHTAVISLDALDAMQSDDFTAADKELLYATADSALASPWVKVLAADTLVAASNHWLKNEAFAGIERPAINATVDPLITRLLVILTTETPVTLEEDLHTVMDVVGDILASGLLEETDDPNAMLQSLSQSGLLNTTMDKLKANPRLAPLVAELKSLSVRLMTDMLGLDSLKNGEHAELMNDVAATLNDAKSMSEEERHQFVSNALDTALADRDYEIPEDVANEVADKIYEDLADEEEITGEILTQYLVDHADEFADVLPDELPEGDIDIPESILP